MFIDVNIQTHGFKMSCNLGLRLNRNSLRHTPQLLKRSQVTLTHVLRERESKRLRKRGINTKRRDRGRERETDRHTETQSENSLWQKWQPSITCVWII